MLGTAMPMWATRAAESVISPVNITSAREGVEGHGRSTSGGGHRRHVRSGSRAAPRARGGGLLGDVVWPIMDQLAGEYHGKLKFAKMDVDENQKTAMRFNVRSIPSILFFKDGRHVDTLVGAYPKPVFEQKIQQHLS